MIDSIFRFKYQHLTTLAIIGTIFVVHHRYKYSCFGFVTYRGDEENNDNKQDAMIYIETLGIDNYLKKYSFSM